MKIRGIFAAILISVFILNGCAFLVRRPAFHSLPSKNSRQGPHVLRGAYHVHTEFSHDSKASLNDVIKTAKKAGLDFVVITDHNNKKGKEAYEKMEKPESPQLVFGVEISTRDGHLVALGVDDTYPKNVPARELIDWIHSRGGYALLAHPVCPKNPWRDVSLNTMDGIEVYDVAHSFYKRNPLALIAKTGFLFPGSFLRSFQKDAGQSLDFWDQKTRDSLLTFKSNLRPNSWGRLAAVASADAHIHFRFLGVTPENFLLLFQGVTMYVLVKDETEKEITDALGLGKSFIAFESRGLAQGFSFTAEDGASVWQLGDFLTLDKPVQFRIRVPKFAEIRLLRNGAVIHRENASSAVFETREPGVYRVEVYLKGKLWILSNPIYAEPSGS